MNLLRGLCLLLCLQTALFSTPAVAADPIRIGVLAYRPEGLVVRQWQPLVVALERAIPEQKFTITALNYQDMEEAVASRRLDFVLTNSSHYILLAHRFGLSSPLATLMEEVNNQELGVVGGVVFCRDDAMSIRSLENIAGKMIAVPTTQSFGGFQMQAYELQKQGLAIPDSQHLLMVGMPHDNVVNTVLSGKADVGFVRTGVLESMAREGALDLKQIKVLNHQALPGFPQASSTHLYPEWPFAALPHINENLARHVAAALFTLEENKGVTRAMGIHGFVVPADYSPVEALLQELRLPPFDVTPDLTVGDVWHHYRWRIVGATIVLVLLLLLWARLMWFHRKLADEHGMVLKQQAQLLESEERFRSLANSAPVFIWISDSNNEMTWFNQTALDFRGRSLEQEVGRGWAEGVHPDDFQRCFEIFMKHVEKRESFTMEFRLKHRDGAYHWIFDHGIPRFDAQNHFLGYIGSAFDITDRVDAEAKLRTLSAAIEQGPASVVIADTEANIEYVNPRFTEVTGYSPDEVIGENPRILQSGMTPKFVHREMWDKLTAGHRWRGELINKRKNGEIYWEEALISPVKNEQGRVSHYVATKVDITERKLAERALAKSEASLQAILDNVPYLIWMKDADSRFMAVNKAFIKTTGRSSAGEIIGLTDFDLWPMPLAAKYREDDLDVLSTCQQKLTEELSMDNGEMRWVETFKAPVQDKDGNLIGTTGFARDITDRKRAEELMQHLAHYDQLTDLPNRTLYADRLQQALVSAKRDKTKLAVMFIDLDKFKPINDTLGHNVGDLVLKEVAKRMQSCLRESDTVARIGGDEFVVLLPQIEVEQDAMNVAEKIRCALNLPIEAMGQRLEISSSTGVAIYPEHGVEEKALMKNADTAMYYAKTGGRNNVRIYHPDMT